jgi:regulatory protein
VIDGPTPGSAADQVPAADPVEFARAILLRRLAAAPRSRAELEKDLIKRGVAAAIAAQLLDRFEEVGLVNDQVLARDLVTWRHEGRALARRAISVEMRRRGIDDETSSQALSVIDDEAERERAREFVRAKLRTTRGLAPEARIRRLVGALARKGYSPGLAYGVVREELATETSEEVLENLLPHPESL